MKITKSNPTVTYSSNPTTGFGNPDLSMGIPSTSSSTLKTYPFQKPCKFHSQNNRAELLWWGKRASWLQINSLQIKSTDPSPAKKYHCCRNPHPVQIQKEHPLRSEKPRINRSRWPKNSPNPHDNPAKPKNSTDPNSAKLTDSNSARHTYTLHGAIGCNTHHKPIQSVNQQDCQQ